LEWTHNNEPITNLSGSPFSIAGPYKGSLAITGIEKIHADIACIARENGSMLSTTERVHLDVEGNELYINI
jgi:hypothetical protein